MPTTSIEHLNALTSLGARPIASPANQRAADMISGFFTALGLQTEEQPYSATAWELASAAFEIDNQLEFVEPNAFSLPCDISAPVVAACTITELEKLDIHGKIVLFYGELASRPIAPKSWFLKEERDERIVQRLENGKPAALIAPPASTVEYEQVSEDWELDLPAATISPETARFILTRQPGSVHLKLDCRRSASTARNVVARLPEKNTNDRVIICAHFDTKINTPGALDNASGTACLLALAEYFSDKKLPFTLEFIAFNGEEYLPMGDDEYLRRYEDSFGQIIAAINMDGVGFALGTNNITAMSGSPAFNEIISEIVKKFPAVTWVEPWLESNHSTFSFRGVPSIALGSTGSRSTAHTPGDAASNISAEKLNEVIELVSEIMECLEVRSYREDG